MHSNAHNAQVLVIPCSGIGKVHGLVSREAAIKLTDHLLPDKAATVCLALLVTGEPETRQKVRDIPCITLDGCPKLCAQKNVELSGGRVAKAIRVYDVMKRHRGAKFGTATALTEDGWLVVDELATDVAQAATHEIST